MRDLFKKNSFNRNMRMMAAAMLATVMTVWMMSTGIIGISADAGLLSAAAKISSVAAATSTAATETAATVAATDVTEIRTVAELVDAAKSSTGNYKLMADLDMSGIKWTSWDFEGTFDGNGHSILNLSVKQAGSAVMTTYDGNRKSYETYGAGFFGKLTNSTVKGLSIYGADIEITTDKPMFAAPIAGLCDNSAISDCTIKDTSVSLTDSAKMWGTGGIVGFGSGSLDDVTTDITLICVDSNISERDEQFMGGAYAAGFLDIRGCSITIDGYDSDHGYVHDGGLVGMYMVYPVELVSKYEGEVVNNEVYGMITFYEDNTDRRAYCSANMGEVMNWTYSYSGFKSDFTRNETYDYTVTLKPEMCATPSYSTEATEPTAKEFGYTTHTCAGCGYTYRDTYTIHEHNVSEYTSVKEPSEAGVYDGIESGVCSLCGQTVYSNYTALEEQPDAENTAAAAVGQSEESIKSNQVTVPVIIGIVAAAAVVTVIIVIKIIEVRRERRRRNHRRHR